MIRKWGCPGDEIWDSHRATFSFVWNCVSIFLKTDLGKTCILEMFSELFYKNFILNVVSIELVQF